MSSGCNTVGIHENENRIPRIFAVPKIKKMVLLSFKKFHFTLKSKFKVLYSSNRTGLACAKIHGSWKFPTYSARVKDSFYKMIHQCMKR